MGSLRDFLIDVGRNAYGLGENVASLGSAAIAEPVAGFAAMYDPTNGAQAIREGMTYQPRTEAGKMYQQGAATTLGAIAKPVMPVIDAWQRGVDIAGRYSPMAGAALQTVPTALGVALGAKPALQQGRQLSNSLGAMQQRMIANASAPRTLNTGYMGQRGAVGTQRPLTEFEQAHLLAQQRAALPVNQRGLDLPANNTAMDRARAMGWDTDAYHQTDADIDKFVNKYLGQNTVGNAASKELEQTSKIGHWFSGQPFSESPYELRMPGNATYPVLLRNENPLELSSTGQLIGKLEDEGLKALKKELKDNDYDSIVIKRDKETGLTSFVIPNSKNIRSRFAAFDPFNRDSANLLAQYGAIAPATTLGAYMYNEKHKQKKQGQ